ncbi:MAG: hypothetical protein OEV93_02200 [Candidatus Moranbacteria bacterium]|nr:hypothetical protein [Candidatus Moranbacteria bacterium]
MKNKKRFVAATVSFSLIFAFAVSASMVAAKQGGNSNGGDKKVSQSSKGKDKSKEIKNYEKPEKEKTNAKIHKEKTSEVSGDLKGVAKKEEEKNKNKNKGDDQQEMEQNQNGLENEEVVTEMEEVAEEIAETSEETAEAIEKVESRNKFKKMLVGTDYKNLGQLRSSLVKNENQIRKLTRVAEKTQAGETDTIVDEQLIALMQERERIKAVIQENQDGFSILGWAVKLFGGYTDEEIDEETEEQLEEDVLEVIENEVEIDEMMDEMAEGTETM